MCEHVDKIQFCKNCKGMFRIDDNKEHFNEDYFNMNYTKLSDIERFPIQRKFLKILHHYKPSGKLLELGCGGGHFIKLAKDCGYDVTGIDPNIFSAKSIEERFGIKIITGIAEKTLLEFSDNQFDLIAIINSLQNVSNPIEVLKEVRRILKDDGIVFVILPNYNGTDLLFKKIYPKSRLLYPTVYSFKSICKLAGLEIESIKTTYISAIIESLFKSRIRFGNSIISILKKPDKSD